MITQKITTRLSNDVLPPVRMVSGDVGREIQLEIYANDESLAPIDLETYSARITIIKPDKTFVIQDFDNDKVELPEQAGAVTGHGYYQIKIYTAGDHQIYTGQGPFIVDDDVLSDEMIESVAEVNGYEFPDDFLTDADLREYVTKYELEDALAGIIDDDTTDYNSTWSSSKISEALSPVTKTVSGNPIEFSDGADAPLVKCVSAITGYQSGSGTPSPDNILPIVAYTEGEIEVRGKNLYNKDGTDTSNGYVDNSWLGSDNIISNNNNYCISEYIPIKSSTSYALSGVSGNYPSIIFFDSTKTYISGIAYEQRTTFSFTSPNNAKYCKLSVLKSNKDIIQLEEGTQATTYVPYVAPTTHTTTYPSAIYRGSEDVVNGEVESEMLCDDLGDFTWTKASGFSNKDVFYTPLSSLSGVPKYVIYQVPNAISSVAIATYQQAPVWEIGTFVFVGIEGVLPANTLGFIVPLGAYSDATTFKTAMTGQKIAYEIATPTTSSITPTNLPIKSLSGYNHIESSTGEMEIEYIKQTYDAIMEATKLDNMKVYSTAEQVVGKWVDGSMIYERAVTVTNAVADGTRTTISDPTFTGCHMISISGYAKRSVTMLGGDIITYPINTYESSSYNAAAFFDEYAGTLAYQILFTSDTCPELSIVFRYTKGV